MAWSSSSHMLLKFSVHKMLMIKVSVCMSKHLKAGGFIAVYEKPQWKAQIPSQVRSIEPYKWASGCAYSHGLPSYPLLMSCIVQTKKQFKLVLHWMPFQWLWSFKVNSLWIISTARRTLATLPACKGLPLKLMAEGVWEWRSVFIGPHMCTWNRIAPLLLFICTGFNTTENHRGAPFLALHQHFVSFLWIEVPQLQSSWVKLR